MKVLTPIFSLSLIEKSIDLTQFSNIERCHEFLCELLMFILFIYLFIVQWHINQPLQGGIKRIILFFQWCKFNLV